MLISIIIGLVFFFLLGKAILETIWGSCLIIYGVFCQILAVVLYSIAFGIEIFGSLVFASKKQNNNQNRLSSYCKMWIARVTLTVLAIIFVCVVAFISNRTLCLISDINWQDCSDWVHGAKAILNKAIVN